MRTTWICSTRFVMRKIRRMKIATIRGCESACCKNAQTPGLSVLAKARILRSSTRADIFAHAAGLLLLAHTGRIRMFGASAPHLMERFIEDKVTALTAKA